MWRIRPLAAFGLALGPLLAPTCARASAPWPGEAFQPRPSLNIVLCDNAFANTGSYGQPSGIVTSQHTRINVDTQAPRYIQTFNVESVLAGVQIYEPYISFIGSSQIGVRRSIPTPAALSTEASAYSARHAALSADRDLGQPNFGALAFPYWSPRTDTAFVLATWLSAPISGYNVGISLNYAENQWTGALEAGFRTTLAGAQDGRSIAISTWGKALPTAAAIMPLSSAQPFMPPPSHLSIKFTKSHTTRLRPPVRWRHKR